MLPEVGGMELLVIAAVALIVVGPKDLPMLLRKLGQFVARLRGMADDFRASFDEMARQSELDDLRKEVEAMRKGQAADHAAAEAANVEINQVFNEIGDSLQGAGIQFHPPMSHQYADPEAIEAPAPAQVPAAKPKAPRAPKAAAKTAASAVAKPKPKPKPKAATVKVATAKPPKKAPAARPAKGTVS
ncbi:MAG: Sec-independent protein translocase protein TatB [Phenylobacterium sp.]|uniref:Sec-independent protein translocase protein TatB n=1 Tax=Phenylobacterium ferrooxidans TaxID=2982689 RepID=A0ABW6CT63_9CAUL|nr:Sec-independent protein translocase protein TatB [Phenylobacterium sp.]MDO8912844.1 Sec-independent protein translocase protein TatB [Phenylobacterium sp.]MDP3101556.1 Sec-independent protein translocase protein TatB [Phenylobacterium sp.]MDP3870200.1 Sec-independent protein translocase protein TatB [Phenylobacterium sp.]MDZ4052245.1 Sec-independent protein translocase protein TatB [Phenylobacterium sp.]